MTSTKRIVCYAINGSGLGHLTRLTAVARWLRRYVALLDQRPPEVVFLTSSDASDALSHAGFAAFKIPSKTVAKKAELDKLEYRRLAKHFVWNTLGVFSPDLLVVDTFPSGSFDELFQVLDGPFKKGFIYRNVKPEYAARPTFRSAIGLYDTVVVPHRDNVAAVPGQQGGNVRHCGEVIQFERPELLPVDAARKQLGVADGDRLVYVSAGGGGDPHAQATLASLVEALRHEPNVHLLVGAGPLYRGERIAGPRLTWFDAPRVWPFFAAVDAAFSAGGYNTFHELLFAQVPTAFFAQPKIADDQARRIREAMQLGACRDITLGHVAATAGDRNSVVATLRELLDQETASAMRDACQSFISENGARRCAIELLRPMYETARLDWAAQVLSPPVAHAFEQIGDGSSQIFPEWLTPLMPCDQIQEITPHPGLNGLLDRLSPAAAKEVQAVLTANENQSNSREFESLLIELLHTIKAADRDAAGGNDARVFADEVLKTLTATLKKQPLDCTSANKTRSNGGGTSQRHNAHGDDGRTRWVCSILQGVRSLLQLAGDDLSELDVLRLYRMFPRIVDVEANESFELFAHFLQQRRSLGEPIPETMHQLQLLKMAHHRVTKATVGSIVEGASK